MTPVDMRTHAVDDAPGAPRPRPIEPGEEPDRTSSRLDDVEVVTALAVTDGAE